MILVAADGFAFEDEPAVVRRAQFERIGALREGKAGAELRRDLRAVVE